MSVSALEAGNRQSPFRDKGARLYSGQFTSVAQLGAANSLSENGVDVAQASSYSCQRTVREHCKNSVSNVCVRTRNGGTGDRYAGSNDVPSARQWATWKLKPELNGCDEDDSVQSQRQNNKLKEILHEIAEKRRLSMTEQSTEADVGFAQCKPAAVFPQPGISVPDGASATYATRTSKWNRRKQKPCKNLRISCDNANESAGEYASWFSSNDYFAQASTRFRPLLRQLAWLLLDGSMPWQLCLSRGSVLLWCYNLAPAVPA